MRLRLLQLPLRRDGLDGYGGAGLQGGRRPVHRQPVAGLYPGRERLPLRQFYTVAVEKCRMENCQLRRAVLAEADVAGLSPHRTGFQEVDFFRTPLKGVDFSDCALEGITVSESLGELRGMKINPAQAVDLIPLLGIQLL